LVYPANYSEDTSVLFFGQIVGGVMKNTDLQQASRTVAKCFLAAMWKHVRFNWKLSL